MIGYNISEAMGAAKDSTMKNANYCLLTLVVSTSEVYKTKRNRTEWSGPLCQNTHVPPLRGPFETRPPRPLHLFGLSVDRKNGLVCVCAFCFYLILWGMFWL